jgi:2-phosphosulfolactate phosphatase
MTVVGIPQVAALRPVPPVVVVIDVLRAFTTAAVALARGADGVVLAATPDDALRIRDGLPGSLAVKDGPPDPAFDAYNSPALMERLDVAGSTVVLATANGTVGAVAAGAAEVLVCASFVVAGATARYLARDGRPATYVATGEDGRAEEDVACAEYLAALLDGRGGADPGPYLDRAGRSDLARRLEQAVRDGYPGVDPDDVAYCLAVDRYDFAMVAARTDQYLVLRVVPA